MADALAIDGHRFLHEDMLALLDRLCKVDRPKPRGRGEDGHIGHLDRILVGVEPDELVLLLHLRLDAVFSFQALLAAVHAIAECVGHGHKLDVAGGAERLVGRTGAATAAADQRHLDGVIGLGERAALDREAAKCRRTAGNRGTGLEKSTAIQP